MLENSDSWGVSRRHFVFSANLMLQVLPRSIPEKDFRNLPEFFSLFNQLNDNGQQTCRFKTSRVRNISILILKIDTLKPPTPKTKSPRLFRGLFGINLLHYVEYRGEWI